MPAILLAEFEHDLISERTKAGLASASAPGRKGGAPFKMTAAKVRLAMSAMGQKETKVTDLSEQKSGQSDVNGSGTCLQTSFD